MKKTQPTYEAPSTGNLYCDRCECECNERCRNEKVSRISMDRKDEISYDRGLQVGETLNCSHCDFVLYTADPKGV